MPSIYKESISLGMEYDFEVKLSCGSLSAEDLGVELVVTNDKSSKTEDFLIKKSFTFVNQSGSMATFRLKYVTSQIGSFSIGLRVYAKNDLLAYQQDSGLVKWM